MPHKIKIYLTQDTLKKNLSYDPDTGSFIRLIGKVSGKEAGHKHAKSGYVIIAVGGKLWQAHRLAWLYVYGFLPNDQIDHINMIRDDNRIVNLREANAKENQWNVKIQSRNTSGVKGVSWDKSRCKWVSMCCINGIQKNLGRFDDMDSAIKARVDYSKKQQSEFFRYG